MSDPAEPLRTLLDVYLRCPTEPARVELEQALRAYQTDWIRVRAGADAPPATKPAADAPAKAAPKKPKFPIAAADLEVLARMADGWVPTIAEVPRWAWFENRELVTLEPNPAGSGPEVMRLSPTGWAAVGRVPS
ncbi:hypothetical protein [Azospirillum rugosum]|uniref:Uncharacterized protein n=1 Tax=Azospirillum rugosum TaxID=416170 RepID=A0ABS4SEA6_9PROT|nr:hypothetical protein [Azospirillum rugosum]MBP2290916.1 hypothetical protein [Azospirillum rugosum]MDQ0525020.1 hypothetical protein [Azospirillum rugosum]